MTDILVVNAELAALIGSLAAIIVPTLMWLAFMVGRWSAWRWYQRNAHEFAESETREKYNQVLAHNAELQRAIQVGHAMVDAREARIKELVSVIRGAHLQQAQSTDMLFAAANGREA